MLAFQAFHLAAYHFAHGTFQPTATGSTTGCFDLDSLFSWAVTQPLTISTRLSSRLKGHNSRGRLNSGRSCVASFFSKTMLQAAADVTLQPSS